MLDSLLYFNHDCALTLRLIDTFSGIGGFSYAAEFLVGGYETIAFVEQNPYCQSILQKHWPEVSIHDDIKTFTPERGSADVICGGFPCQDISTAGKQAGIKKGTRSGLFYEFMRVVRLVRPKYIVLENVSAIVANGLDIVLGEIAEAGFNAEWAVISARDLGACHKRSRWWLVAYSNTIRLPGSKLSLPSLHRSDTRRKISLGNRQTLGSQSRIKWNTWNKPLNPDWRTYVSKPVLSRGDDGLSNRVDRIKALGNAVVPQVAAIPLARIKELAAAD